MMTPTTSVITVAEERSASTRTTIRITYVTMDVPRQSANTRTMIRITTVIIVTVF